MSDSTMGPDNRRVTVGGPDGHANLPGPIDRAARLQAQLDEANELLILAMCKLHIHVVHAGTDFGDRALAHFEENPPRTASGYKDAWEHLAAELLRDR